MESRSFEKLLEALEYGSSSEQALAAEELGYLHDRRAVEPLLGTPGADRNSRVRARAAESLAEMKVTEAVEPAIALLRERDSLARHYALVALAKLRDPRAIGPLIKALRDRSGPERGNTVWALSHFDDPRSAKAVLSALADPSADVRTSAALAVGTLRVREAVDTLVKNLRSRHWDTVRCSAIGLGRIGDVRAVEPLIELLGRSKDAWIRREAAEALGAMPDPRAERYLVSALDRGDPDVLIGAYRFFIRKGIPGSEEALSRALDGTVESYGAHEAAEAFRRSGNPTLEAAGQRNAGGVKWSEDEEWPRWGKQAR